METVDPFQHLQNQLTLQVEKIERLKLQMLEMTYHLKTCEKMHAELFTAFKKIHADLVTSSSQMGDRK